MKINKTIFIMLICTGIFSSIQSMKKKMVPTPPVPMIALPTLPDIEDEKPESPPVIENKKPRSPYAAMINHLSLTRDTPCRKRKNYNLCKMEKAAAKDIINKLKKMVLKLGKDKFTYKMAKNIIAQQAKNVETTMQKDLTRSKKPIFVIKKFYKSQLSSLKQWRDKMKETGDFKVKISLVIHKKLANKVNKAIEEKMINLGEKEISGRMITNEIIDKKIDEAKDQKVLLQEKVLSRHERMIKASKKFREEGLAREIMDDMSKVYMRIYSKKVEDWIKLIHTLNLWADFADSLYQEE